MTSVLMLVVFLLFVLGLFCLSGLFYNLHFFFEVFFGYFIKFSRTQGLQDRLRRQIWSGQTYCLVNGFNSLLLLHFVNDHILKLVYFLNISHQKVYKFELEFLFDDFVADVWAVYKFDKEFLELFAHLEVLYYVIMPFSENLVLYHFYFILALSEFSKFRIFLDVS